MPASFDDMQKDILAKAESSVVSGKEGPYLTKHRWKLKQIIAASTIVIEEEGIEWARSRPEEFVKKTLSSLGFWIKLSLFLGGLLIGGSSLWILMAKFIAPFVVDYFLGQAAAGVCGSGPGDSVVSSLADGAR